jgi:hypothetical protein
MISVRTMYDPCLVSKLTSSVRQPQPEPPQLHAPLRPARRGVAAARLRAALRGAVAGGARGARPDCGGKQGRGQRGVLRGAIRLDLRSQRLRWRRGGGAGARQRRGGECRWGYAAGAPRQCARLRRRLHGRLHAALPAGVRRGQVPGAPVAAACGSGSGHRGRADLRLLPSRSNGWRSSRPARCSSS